MSRLYAAVLLVPTLLAFAVESPPSRLAQAEPAQVGLERLDRIDHAVQEAIDKGQCPGAVVLVLRQDKIAYRKAFGLRCKEPQEELMTADTVFDLASLTKPIATATCVMKLIEDGKLRLTDRVAEHIPEFARNGKSRVTVEQLLLHTAGFIADNPIDDYKEGRAKALERIYQLAPIAEPGTKFIYSDVGFIVLGELVDRLTDEKLDTHAQRRVFEPLGLRDTTFKPNEQVAQRCAPTQKRDETWMRGVVHDPRAHLLGGVAGHAGLFSTADDLAVYAQMLLNEGHFNGKRILSPATVRLMTTPRPVPGGWRALGWDVQTSFSANRGELFPFGSYGHTGFTGTSIWIDPSSQTAVIFLSNRVHPDGKGNVTRLRGQVSTLVASGIVTPPFPKALELRATTESGVATKAGAATERERTPVLTGIDVLKRDGFRRLKDRKIGLVTNHTGLDREGQSTIDLLHKADGVTLISLFSPEHGIRGVLDKPVPDGNDEKTGLPVYSLYGERKRPIAEQLQGIDTLVYDIQDIGCRFYTYSTTLGYVLEAAAQHQLKVVVLDRPNPIGGLAVEGPVLDQGKESFTAYHTVPVRHGLTVGELAQLFNKERKIGADLEVIKVEGWRRNELYDQTGLTWVNPSPNMRSLAAALLYPGIGLLETTNLSVGRGTDRPFEMIGAPWLDGQKLASALNEANLPGVRFVPVRFTPASSVHAGKECGGVQIFIDDWWEFESLKTGITVACHLKRLFPGDWQTKRYPVLLGHQATVDSLEKGAGAGEIQSLWKEGLDAFMSARRAYLLYP